MEIPDIKTFKQGQFSQSFFKKHYPEFYNYLLDKYKEAPWKKFSELPYLYFHNMDDVPKCPVCGKLVSFISYSKGYHTYCGLKCACNSNFVLDKKKQTCLKKYGVKNPSQSELIKKKKIQTSLEHYGVPYSAQAIEVKNKIKQTNLNKYGGMPLNSITVQNKYKDTCLKRYGFENASQAESIKKKKIQTSLKHYGVEYYSQSEEYKNHIDSIMNKSISTKKKNNSLRCSKIELQFKDWLNEHNINYIYQYKSDKYPFNCDFYFPDKDIYLEIQGYWHHGPGPYDPSNKDHQEILNKLIERSKNSQNHLDAINTWTVKDPLKRKIAHDNHLNFIEVFTYDINILVDKVKDIL